MKIDINAFTGMRPAIAARLLDDTESVEVYNADLENGDIIPVLRPAFVAQTTMKVLAIWQHELRHLGLGQPLRLFAEHRNFVESPIANDTFGRLYMSDNDNGGLSMMDSTGTEYKLGVPVPTATPVVTAVNKRHGAVRFSPDTNSFTFTSASRWYRPYLFPDAKVTFTGDTLPGGIVSGTVYGILQATQQTGDVWSYTVYDTNDSNKTEVAITSAGSDVVCTNEKEGSLQNRAYVFTLVDAFGQESAPSLPTSTICDAASAVTLNNLLTPAATAGFPAPTIKRIYRTSTGASGETSYQFVGEIPASSSTYLDNLMDEELGEVLPSADWEMPPSGLKHLVELAGGIMAAHTAGEVMFSDVNHPYAWPDANRYSLDGNIKTLAVSQNTVFAITDGVIYSLTVDPDSGGVYITKLDGLTPCVSAEGVAPTPFGVLFPGQDGLYLIQQGVSSATNVTEKIISEREWKKYVVASLVGCFYDASYMAFFTKEDGTKGTFLIDFSSSQQARMRYISDWGTAVTVVPHGRHIFYASPTGHLDSSSIYKMFADENDGFVLATWRSKDFIFPTPVNFGSLIIESMAAEENVSPDEDTDINYWGGSIGGHLCGEITFAGEGTNIYPVKLSRLITVVVVADDEIRFSGAVKHNRYVRLPKGFAARKWHIIVSTAIPVSRIALGTSTEELR